ncbi:hypothetical protein O0I10_001105 [Lichtheimia ornata]|uniref:Plus3 domain-containing protein n=1 Tax=Lichtheimia ornata TaxID=688661 RepID=A0AAD7Y373_9FUNG|nr:uncharacterized protein O0I10_001105 [Lichtheimia ornata]KAJ8662929.1 hypothetical protein O0I10_001105 [Lichtheimia ornata]
MSKEIDDLILELVDNGGGARSDDDDDGIDEYGPDLYKDEEDRRRLLALPEVERERILSERSEERQRNLERLEVRKLLNDGRREDTTRRSTRAKGSGTSRALNELTRRREEKHKSRSKRGRRSPTPERKRTRYSDESAGEASEIEEDDEYYAETKAKKRTPTLEEMQSIVLRRYQLEKWLYAPYFDRTVTDAYVRIYIGDDSKTRSSVYRLCKVIDIVDWHKTYKISESTTCKKALLLKHGSAERAFTMDIVSNHSLSQQEYTRFINTLEAEHVTLPDIEEVEHKAKDIEKAATYVLSDKEVSEMIKRKQEVAGRTINASMEQAVLLSKLEHARSMQDDQMQQEIQRELDLLKEVLDSDKPRQTRNELPRVATEQSTQQVKVEREREREAQRHRNDMQQRVKRLKDMKDGIAPMVHYLPLYRKVADELGVTF